MALQTLKYLWLLVEELEAIGMEVAEEVAVSFTTVHFQ
jgi:hypothetical protein